MALTQLQHQDARNYLEIAAQIGTEVGAPAVRGWSAWMRGVDQFLAENHEVARGILEEGVALNRETRDPIGLGLCLASLGTVQRQLASNSGLLRRHVSRGEAAVDQERRAVHVGFWSGGGAGGGNRTPVPGLEGWCTTHVLRPLDASRWCVTADSNHTDEPCPVFS